jgi:hypothetical protein
VGRGERKKVKSKWGRKSGKVVKFCPSLPPKKSQKNGASEVAIRQKAIHVQMVL